MSYLGLQPNTPLLNTSTQFLSGNSVATQFTLSRSVASASDIDVMIGSALKIPFIDYTAGNISLQFATAPASGSNNISVTYRAGALNSLDLTASVFNAGTVAAPSVVSLAANNTGLYWANASSMSVTVSGTNRATFMANAVSISTDTGALIVDGGLGVDGNVNIGGAVGIADTTESTSVSTGAFKLLGGAGIVGNLNIGGDITCVGDFTVNGTFTTTGTDSLAVTDPFIFLAENNPGDTYDSGVISQFYDGANLRYTGYFRDITDAKYKLFTNLLTEPTTTVDTTDPSFQLTDLVLSNLSASGNVTGTYFVGNGAALTGISTTSSNIFLGNTSVSIPAVNGNVNAVINSVLIANIWSGGISVVGAVAASTTISATGNITGGNVLTGGLVSATGNVTSAANVAAGNVLTGGLVSAAGNVTGDNVNATTAVSAGGNVQGGNLRTAGTISATGDVYGNSFIATSNVQATLNVSATGNVTGGNIVTGGIVSATGNITGSYFLGNGSALTGIDATSIQNGTSNVKVVSSGGNVTVSVGGTSNVAVFSTGGINVTANVVGGNINTAGVVSSTANIIGANLVTAGNVFASAMIANTVNDTRISLGTATGIIAITSTGNTTQFGPGGQITLGGASQIIGGTFGGSGITLGTSQTDIFQSRGGNVTVQVGSGGTIANTWTFAQNGSLTSPGALSAVGNVIGGNINTAGIIEVSNTSGLAISAAGNVTGGNIITNGAISAGGLITATGNITGGNISTAGLITATGNIASTANVSGGNIIGTLVGNVTGTTVSVTGNITGGNLNAAGLSLSSNVVSQIATTANVTGGNLISTSVTQAANSIVTGAITTPSWTTTGVGIRTVASTYTDSSTGAAGTAASNHVHVLAQPTIEATNSLATTTTAATLYIAGAPANGTNMTVTNPYAVLVNAGNVGVTANINGGNIISAAAVSAVSVSASGNITGGNVLGGANVNATLFTGTTVSVTGTVTAASVVGGVMTGSSVSVTGTVTAASVVGGVMSGTSLTVSTGNISGGNINNNNTTGVGNIGTSTVAFNTVFAKATSAQYADLAEWYEADADYPPGTVLIFGGDREVTEAIGINDVRVAGVVSTNPAHIMNAGLEAPHIAAVALTGRVPTLVVGAVAKGDMMVTAGGGRAKACAEPRMGSVIGKALQDHPGGQGTIEIVVGRL